jgi:hypothetical protein
MLFADASQTQNLVVTAGGYVLALIFGLLLLLRLGKTARKAAHAADMQKHGVLRIDPSDLIDDACYIVHEVLLPIEQDDTGTLAIFILESFVHLGDPAPHLMVRMMLRPETLTMLKSKRLAQQPIAMQWKNKRPTFE